MLGARNIKLNNTWPLDQRIHSLAGRAMCTKKLLKNRHKCYIRGRYRVAWKQKEGQIFFLLGNSRAQFWRGDT